MGLRDMLARWTGRAPGGIMADMAGRRWYDDVPQYWTTEDVARELGVTRRTVRLWIDKRKLRPDAWYAYGASHAPLFLPDRVRAWRARQR